MLGRVRQALRALDLTQETVVGEAQASIAAAASSVAAGAQNAASSVQRKASQIQGGVIEIRKVIRAQPITAALFVFVAGYLLGRLGSLFHPAPGDRR